MLVLSGELAEIKWLLDSHAWVILLDFRLLLHSYAADLQWPELANLICQDSPEDASAHRYAVIDNPAVADWFSLSDSSNSSSAFTWTS